MVEPNIIGGLTGGMLIGLAALLHLALNGRMAGISGILGGIISSHVRAESAWRLVFLLGLICGAGIYTLARDGLPVQIQADGPTMALAGLLVGFGTRLGSGCTSGHGVCGLGRRSSRSLVATVTFIVCGIITVYLTRRLF